MGYTENRFGKRDVGRAFNAFLRAAAQHGFNTADGWTLYAPDADCRTWQLVRVTYVPVQGSDTYGRRVESTPFPRDLGTTAREAYNTLSAFVTALDAVQVQRQGEAPLRVQRHPGDKWRWVPGGDAGGWYCELRRIPADGTPDGSSYDQSNYVGSEKKAAHLCAKLNESLSMGGMLGAKPDWM